MNISKDKKLKLYTNLVRARAYDKLFASLLRRGKLMGFYHQVEGGEAPGVGACSFLRDDDFLWPHYRGHSVPHMISKGIDPKTYVAEHCGKATGMANGLGVIHMYVPDKGLYGMCGAVGFQFNLTVGFGLAAKQNGKGQIVMSTFGDGATNRGVFHESLLMATQWNLPIVYVCENNGLAMFVTFDEIHKGRDVVDLVKGYGIPTQIVDGQDVFAVAKAVIEAVERTRKGEGPTFIECKTVRYHEHDIGTPDLVGTRLRTKEEIDELRKRDPIILARNRLVEEGILDDELTRKIDQQTEAEMKEVERFADESPLPDPSILESALYA